MSNDNQMTPAAREHAERERIRRVNEEWRRRHVDLALAILGPEATRRAEQIGSAFYGLLAQARPHERDDIMRSSEASRVAAIRAMADLDLYPGGPAPTCWLIPKRKGKGGPYEIHVWLSHRGWAALAARDGVAIVTYPVHVADDLEVEDGLVIRHASDPTRSPTSLRDLAGVTVRVMRDGMPTLRLWTPRQIIEAAQSKAQTDMVWGSFPVEMAQKTAIKYHAARGHIPIDSTAWQRAHEVEIEEVAARVEVETSRRGKAALPDYSAADYSAADRVEEPEYADPARADDGGAE